MPALSLGYRIYVVLFASYSVDRCCVKIVIMITVFRLGALSVYTSSFC